VAEQLALQQVLGMAPQRTARNSGSYDGEGVQGAATSSLPVPLSPVIKTGASDGPTCRITSKTFRTLLVLAKEPHESGIASELA
jgi:hypothetical protein